MAVLKSSSFWLTLAVLLASCVFVSSCVALMGTEGLVFSLCLLSAFACLAFKRRGGFTLGELLVVIAICGILMALIQPVYSESRAAVRMKQCASQLEAVAEAIHAYEDDQGGLPPACVRDKEGRPMHSWRVLILPYLGYKNLYTRYRFDEPWNGPNNSKLIESMPAEYACPEITGRRGPHGVTTCVAVVGAKTIWPDDRVAHLEDIRDGADRTIMVGEASRALGIRWLEPRDVNFKKAASGLNARPYDDDTVRGKARDTLAAGHHASGALVAMADTSVRGLPVDTAPQALRSLLTASGGEAVDIDTVASKRLNPPKRFWKIDRMTALACFGGSLLSVIVSLGWYSWIVTARRRASAEGLVARPTPREPTREGFRP